MMKKNSAVSPYLTIFASLVLATLVTGCEKKIEPGTYQTDAPGILLPGKTATAQLKQITQMYEAVGTVRPRTESTIEARITGQVLSVKVKPGDGVKKGSLMVSIDSRQLKSKIEQARQALKTTEAGKAQARQAVIAAEAALKQAGAAFGRTKTYFESQAATAQDLEKAESAFLQAKAGLQRAKDGQKAAKARTLQAEAVVREAAIALDFTKIVAPEDGVVLKRFVEPGDLALPGKPLVALRTSGAFRLEAYVREGLIARVSPGSRLAVSVETLGKTVDALVEEIVPYADPSSRTFLVKASIPHIDGLYPGMFGKLLIPVKDRKVVVVPRDAVRQVGQLELLYVGQNEKWTTIHVKTGVRMDQDVEILSGLNGGETIGWEVREDG
ncbi:MAG: efflux RND transporter periplasmic adaptor subunit [Desulfobacterales bacterium]|nr:efflux RND transporter periplasmic adaptor subunit [Desulfobacterales bacterium]